MLLSEMTMFDMSMVVAMGVFAGQVIFNTSEALLKGVLLVVEDRLWLYNLGIRKY